MLRPGRSSLAVTVIPLLIGLGMAAGPAPGGAQEPGQVRLGFNRAWVSPALLIAVTQDYFKRAGVAIAEKSFDNPADVVQGIAAGGLDVGVCPAGILFTAVQQGVKVKAVALAQGAQHPPVGYLVRADSGINSVADLRGKTAGIAGYGGNTDLFLRYGLEKAGLDPKTDLKIVFVPFQLTLPAVINKQIDVGGMDSVLQATAAQRYAGQLKVLYTYEDVTKAAIGTTNTNGLLLLASNAFVERDRDTAVRFLEGYLRAIAAVHANAGKAVSEWAIAGRNDAIRALKEPATLPSDGKVYLDELQFEADLALKFGYLKQAIDIRKSVDSSLLDEAARRIK